MRACMSHQSLLQQAELDMLGDEMVESALADEKTPSYITDMSSMDAAPPAASDPLADFASVPSSTAAPATVP
jgi:hypothetical protein